MSKTSPSMALTAPSAGFVDDTLIFSGRMAKATVVAGGGIAGVLDRMIMPSPAPMMRAVFASRAGDRAFEHVHVADEIGDETRVRRLVDLGRRRHLHDLALVHDGDAVGHGHRLFLVVGDDDEGQAELLLQVHQLELRFLAQLLVERAERLVEQQHLRPLGDRAGQRHALALAAGELVRLALGELRRA